MKRIIKNAIIRFKSIPLRIRIVVGSVLLFMLYTATFLIPTNIQLSYANTQTCANWLMIAPDLQKQRAGKDEFLVYPSSVVKVFNVALFSNKVCVTPSVTPKEGRTKVSVAPFGLPLFSKSFGINTPGNPVADVGALKGTAISVVKPLLIPLSQKDMIHTYSLRQDEKTASCRLVERAIACDISTLTLQPSSPYELSLERGFQKEKSQKIERLSIRTLDAVQLVDASVKSEATLYDKPTDFRFVFDRELESAEGAITQTDATTIDARFDVEGKTVIVTPKKPLPRNTTYTLTLRQVTGKDGASLAASIPTKFVVSGGPKVSGISVGPTLVAQNARIIVTFDQALKPDVDMAKFVRITGVVGSVSRASDNSIAVTITTATQCAAFNISIDEGVPSGSNDEVSADPWKFDGRIICGSSSVIGYSVRGRAIVAYTFGSGGSTTLFTGGMHGSEPSGMSTMQAWVSYLQANGYKVPADKTVVIVPNTNPDGIAVGSRNNINNVNIDRNFPASNWRPDIDTASGLLPTGGGTSAGSEPETKALIALTTQLRPRLEVSFHAQGSLVGANQYGDSIAIGTAYARTVGYGTMIGNAEEVMGYSITGEYEDWMGQALNIPAILIELPSSSGNYINSQLNALLNLLTV
ncbi:DUF2817 domain-containing protein [Candidatus Saccharibacteria bacterium]|nr:DUF2817 domain-containing protein [Candidatus Saccharibacteria bacterium]